MRMFRVPDPQNTNTGFCQKKQRIFSLWGLGESVNIFQWIFWILQSVYPFVLKWDVCLFRCAPCSSWWTLTKFGSKSMSKTNELQTWTCVCLYSGCLADCLNLNLGFAILLSVSGLLAWPLWYVVPCVTDTMETLYWFREVAEAKGLDSSLVRGRE